MIAPNSLNEEMLTTAATKYRFLLLILALLIASCSSTSQHRSNDSQPQQVKLFHLTSVPKELQNRLWVEKFTITIEGQSSARTEQSMLLQSELSDKGIGIAAMSFEGVPIAQASWDQTTGRIESDNNIASQFNVERVIYDLQSINWPLSVLRQHLLDNVSVAQQFDKGAKIRQFYHQNQLIIVIREIANEINFKHLQLGYQLVITRLEDSALEPTRTGQLERH